MDACCEVFQRVEKKYRVSAGQRGELERVIGRRMSPDGFGRARVTSLYFDTPRCELIGRSLEKPLYKEKVRLRAYGLAAGEALAPEREVFFEMKKKFKGVVYKRRVRMSAAAARAFFDGLPYEEACRRFPLPDESLQEKSLDARSRQIAREIGAMFRRYEGLQPSMIISCERVAWRPDAQGFEVRGSGAALSREDGSLASDLRITFDGNLEARDVRETGFDGLFDGVGGAVALGGVSGAAALGGVSGTAALDGCGASCCGDGDGGCADAGEGASEWFPLLSAGEGVMEVKSAGPFPLWLAHGLSECAAFPASFSKYGTAYTLAGA